MILLLETLDYLFSVFVHDVFELPNSRGILLGFLTHGCNHIIEAIDVNCLILLNRMSETACIHISNLSSVFESFNEDNSLDVPISAVSTYLLLDIFDSSIGQTLA